MKGDKQNKEIASYRLIALNEKVAISGPLDFPVKKMNDRTTDLQMPLQ